jgi:SAM-dependent methyltransferase
MDDPETYAFANRLAVQRERLQSLEAVLDAGTIRLLEARGVGPGWRCLEVGAGHGSIAAWLCERVAPGGSVLATDLDPTLLGEVARPNLEVRAHDVRTDELPEGAFDLVHLRLLLAWLAEPGAGLRRLVAALKPGGWLVAEELDFRSVTPDPGLSPEIRALFARVMDAHHAVLTERHAFDLFYGRRVAGELAGAGLVHVGGEGRTTVWRGGEPGGAVWRLTLAQLREPMIASGRVTPDEVDRAMALCGDPQFSFRSPVTMAAWGRRPAPA